MPKKLSASGARSLRPTGTAPPTDFELGWYGCDL